jgi:8-oxo-dGTP diphosphatase
VKTVTAAIIVVSDRVLLVRRAPGEKLEGKWEFPGGKLHEEETLEQCLQRELREELGVEARVGAIVAESIYEYEHGVIRLVALDATIVSGRPQLTVHDRLEWVAPDQLEVFDLAPADIPIARIVRQRLSN